MNEKWLEFLKQWRESLPAGIFPQDAAADANVSERRVGEIRA